MRSHRFEEIRKLGEGGIGVVYAVRDRLDGDRVVALKEVRDLQHRQALAREFHVLSELAHVHLPAVYHFDAGGENQSPFFTMELCDGSTLQEWAIGADRSFEESVGIAKQLIRVLAHIHDNGRVHGDLNPANVMVLDDVGSATIKVIDFDVSGGEHVAGTVSGALPYLAPERLEGEAPSVGSDLFSLGILLHIVFFGEHPFPGYPEKLSDDLGWEAPTSGEARKLEPVLSRLLLHDPSKRPASARELVGYLAQAIGEGFSLETGPIVRARASRGPRVDLGGEANNLAALLKVMVTDGDSAAVHVAGSAGSGRSRFLRDASAMAEQQGARVAHVVCQSGERVLHAVDRLLVQIYRAAPGGIPEEVIEMPPALRRAVSARFAHWAPPDGWPEEGEDDLRSSRAHLLDGLARALVWGRREQPLVVLVDSFEQAESETRDVVTALARAIASGGSDGVLLVTAGTESDGLGVGQTMTLRAFTPAEVERYVGGVFPGRSVTRSASNALHRWSGGSPKLFVEGLVSFFEDGQLQVDAEEVTWAPTAQGAVSLPGNMEGLLGTRVEALPDEDGRVLFTTALLEVPATPALIASVLEGDASDTWRSLERLTEAGLLNRFDDGSGVHYLMAGVFVADIVQGRMSFDEGKVRELHQKASLSLVSDTTTVGATGRVIHTLLGGAKPDRETLEMVLASVRDQADRSASAEVLRILAYVPLDEIEKGAARRELLGLQVDALQALGRFADAEEAAATLQNASDTPQEKAMALRRRGVLGIFRGSYGEADVLLEEALTSLSALDDVDQVVGEVKSWRAQGKLLAGNAREAISIAEETLQSLSVEKERATSVLRGRLCRILGHGLIYLGDLEKAHGRFSDARIAFEEAESPGEIAILNNAVGMVNHRQARYGEALTAYRSAMDVFEEMGNRTRQGACLMNMGVIHQEQGEYTRAMEQYHEALAVAEVLGDRSGVLRVANNLGNLHLHLGELESAHRHVARSLALCRGEGNRFIEGYNLSLLGEIARMKGAYSGADDYFQKAIALFDELECVNELAQVQLERAQLALDRNRFGETRTLGQEALNSANAQDFDDLKVKALSLLAEAERQSPEGDLDQAGKWVEDALAFSAELDNPEVVWPVRVTASRVARDRGDLEEARVHALEGLKLLRGVVRGLAPEHQSSFRSVHGRREAEEEMRWVEVLDAAPSVAPGMESDSGSLTKLLEINKRLNMETDPSRLLEFIMDSAILLTGAERGFLLLCEPANDRLKIRVARNIDQENITKGKLKISTSIAERVMEEGQPIVTVDAMQDDRYKELMSVHSQRLRSILCLPLQRSGKSIGVLYIDNRFKINAFDSTALNFMEAFADQAAIAIGNARLFKKMEKTTQELEVSQKEVDKLNRKLEEKLIRTNQALQESQTRVQRQQRQLENRHQYQNIVGSSDVLRDVLFIVDRVKDNDVPVLIGGDSGTGKELVARAVHYNGKRRSGEFVAVNCGSIPPTLFESELFGHMRGSFTGANQDKRGLFEVAHKGTLFLDEMGEMPLEMQVKLLRVLQTGDVQKIGSPRPVKVDVRVIVATNRDLKKEVAEKRFREDLYYRLNVVNIRIPALRERLEDIPLLVQHFLQINRDTGLSTVESISPEALALLARYDWPGNIRELDTVIKNASLFSEEDVLTEKNFQHFEDIVRAAAAEGRPLGAVRGEGIAFRVGMGLSELEREAIVQTLEALGGNKKKTAEVLGIDRRTLYNKLTSHGIRIEKKATVIDR